MLDGVLAVRQRLQCHPHTVQVTPAFFGQAHAAGGAGEQADAEAGFKALEGNAGRRRREAKATGGGRQAAGVRAAHEDFKVENRTH